MLLAARILVEKKRYVKTKRVCNKNKEKEAVNLRMRSTGDVGG